MAKDQTQQKSTTKAGTTSLAYDRMEEKWPMIDDLLGGTTAMRLARVTWLPQEPKEDPQAYEIRLGRSVLHPAYEDSVERVISKPFQEDVTIKEKENLPEPLDQIEFDADREGSSLTQFAAEVMAAAVNYGLTHVLCDYPETTKSEIPVTKKDEKTGAVRPYFIHYLAKDVLYWEYERDINGERTLTEVHLREWKIERDDEGKEQEVQYIRIYRLDDWELYKKEREDGEAAFVESGTHSYGRIPLKTFYTNKTGFMTASPPLEKLAFLNVAHWQSMSDQRNILRFVRCAILSATGYSEEELPNVIISPNQVIRSNNTEAEIKWVEHSGKGVEAGENDLIRLEERMEILGLQPMIQRTAKTTATGKILDESKNNSLVQAWIRGLESMFDDLYEIASNWMSKTLPEDFGINIYADFAISLRGADDVTRLLEMRKTVPPQISHETFLKEIQRRSVISEDIDVTAEMATIEQEQSQINMIDEGSEFDEEGKPINPEDEDEDDPNKKEEDEDEGEEKDEDD